MNDQPSIITRLHILNEESFYIDYMCNYVLSFSEQIKNHLFFDTRFYTRFYDENTCKINKNSLNLCII